jgi:hypothetical protein
LLGRKGTIKITRGLAEEKLDENGAGLEHFS